MLFNKLFALIAGVFFCANAYGGETPREKLERKLKDVQMVLTESNISKDEFARRRGLKEFLTR